MRTIDAKQSGTSMSWLYDALKRVEKENPATLEEAGTAVLTDDGGSFLGTLESIASVGLAPSKVEVRLPVPKIEDGSVKVVPQVPSDTGPLAGIGTTDFGPSKKGY